MALFGKKDSDKKPRTVKEPESTKKSTDKDKKFMEKPKSLLLIAGGLAITVAGLFFFILSQTIPQTSYYVLNQNVPARTLVQPNMLTEVRTTTGAEPRNAMQLGEVQQGDVYTKYALSEGDILSPSNAGDLIAVNEGIPKNFVTVSFSVPAENAVAGNLKRGDYIDIIAASGNATEVSSKAQYVLRHVLLVDVLDQAVSLSEASGGNSSSGTGEVTETGTEESSSGSGVANLYTVAVSQQDATKIALLQGVDVLLALSPAEGVQSEESISSSGSEIFGDEPVGDSGAGTSPSFDGETNENQSNQPNNEEQTTDSSQQDESLSGNSEQLPPQN